MKQYFVISHFATCTKDEDLDKDFSLFLKLNMMKKLKIFCGSIVHLLKLITFISSCRGRICNNDKQFLADKFSLKFINIILSSFSFPIVNKNSFLRATKYVDNLIYYNYTWSMQSNQTSVSLEVPIVIRRRFINSHCFLFSRTLSNIGSNTESILARLWIEIRYDWLC